MFALSNLRKIHISPRRNNFSGYSVNIFFKNKRFRVKYPNFGIPDSRRQLVVNYSDRAMDVRIIFKSFLLFLFILDTGGWIGIRPLIILLWLININKININKFDLKIMSAWFSLIILSMPALYQTYLESVEFSSFASKYFPILLFPVFYFLLKINRYESNTFAMTGLFFSLFIIILYVGKYFGISQIEQLISYLDLIPEAGFFSEKAAYSDSLHPTVYFKGTLVLVIFACICIVEERLITLLCILGALFVAPSRFGVLILLLFYINNICTYLTPFIRKYAAFTVTAITLFLCYVFVINNDDIQYSLAARLLHVSSITDYFSKFPMKFLFGFGPGTEFYSYGFERYTDDIEISQLELLRRYGVVFFFILHFFLINLLIIFRRNNMKSFFYGILGFYIAALSNPVLTSVPAMIIFAGMISSLSNLSTNCRKK